MARYVITLVVFFFLLTRLWLFLGKMLCFFSKMLKEILISFRIFSKNITRITVIYLVLIEWSYLHFVRILSFLLLMRIHLLLKLYSDWSWMSVRFCIFFVIIWITTWCTKSFISWGTCSKLKTIFVIFSSSRVSCWKFSFTQIWTFSIYRSLTISHQWWSTRFRLVNATWSRIFSWRRSLLIEELRVENPRLALRRFIPIFWFLFMIKRRGNLLIRKDKFVSLDKKIRSLDLFRPTIEQ